nr:hypothetical protein [uncultured Pseudomonas sp.]
MKRLVIFNYCILALACVLQASVQAADGDVIITRDVQPRVATRAALVPDPNPLSVNPGRSVVDTTAELADGDFANVSSGLALPAQLLGNSLGHQVQAPLQQSMPGLGASHSGSGGNGVASQVNRSVQQGLRPLQMLGDR